MIKSIFDQEDEEALKEEYELECSCMQKLLKDHFYSKVRVELLSRILGGE